MKDENLKNEEYTYQSYYSNYYSNVKLPKKETEKNISEQDSQGRITILKSLDNLKKIVIKNASKVLSWLDK